MNNNRFNLFRVLPKSGVLFFASAIVFFIAFHSDPAHSQVFQITVPMNGNQEVPPAATGGTGLGNLTVNTATGMISGTVTFSGLTTPSTAGTMLLPGAVLLPDQAAALMSNGLYLNIHTTANLNGEIRGQILFTTAIRVGSINDPVPLVDVVSGDFAPERPGDELAGLSADGRIFISLDLTTWIELPGSFVKLIKGDFNGDGIDDLGGLNETGDAVLLTTDFGLSFTEVPAPVE
jgi:hypothetical protein